MLAASATEDPDPKIFVVKDLDPAKNFTESYNNLVKAIAINHVKKNIRLYQSKGRLDPVPNPDSDPWFLEAWPGYRSL